MSDPISGQIVQQVTEQATQQGAAQPQPEVDAADQAQFEDALENKKTGEVETSNRTDRQPPTQTENVQNAAVDGAQPPTLGDAILDGLRQVQDVRETRLDRIQEQLEAVDGEVMSMQEALKLQMEVMQMGLEQDLMTKTADKTSQGAQTLFQNR